MWREDERDREVEDEIESGSRGRELEAERREYR